MLAEGPNNAVLKHCPTDTRSGVSERYMMTLKVRALEVKFPSDSKKGSLRGKKGSPLIVDVTRTTRIEHRYSRRQGRER